MVMENLGECYYKFSKLLTQAINQSDIGLVHCVMIFSSSLVANESIKILVIINKLTFWSKKWCL